MEQRSLVERLERLELENSGIRRSARFMKFLMVATITVAAAMISVPMANSKPSVFSATEFDLLGATGKVTAKLMNLNGGASLLFYDSGGKLVSSVGFTNTASVAAAGLTVWDGNAILAGDGIARAGFGYTSRGPSTGIGAATWDASGNVRSAVGQGLDGSLAYEVLYDNTGALRTGIEIPSGANIGYFNQDANGTPRVSLYESANGLVASLSLVHQSGIEGADAIANDEYGFVGSNFAAWNADHSHIAGTIGVNSADNGFGYTTYANGSTSFSFGGP